MAAYLVLFAHALSYSFTDLPHYHLAGLAHFGMTLFFVLSGFVIAYNYSDVRGLSGNWRFFVARFSRLYPLYILVLIVCRLRFPDPAPYDNFLHDPVAAVAGLTLTQSWINVAGISGTAFGQSWSISSEWFLYALFPLLALIPVRRALWTLNVTLVVIAAGCGILFLYETSITAWLSTFVRDQPPLSAPVWVWLTYFSPYLRIVQFVAGILTCHAFLQLRDSPIPFANTILWACVAAIALVIGVYPRYMATGGWVFDMLHVVAFLPSCVFGMLVICHTPSATARLLSGRVAEQLGEISYSVYAFQFLVLAEMTRYLPKGVTFCIASIVTITILSFVTYWLFERPSRQLLRRLMLGPSRR